MLGSMTKTPLAANLASRRHFRSGISQKHPISRNVADKHLAIGRVDLQQRIAKKASREIFLGYHIVIGVIAAIANLAAFTSACPLLVAAVRGACNPSKSALVMPNHYSGIGFSAVENEGIRCVNSPSHSS